MVEILLSSSPFASIAECEDYLSWYRKREKEGNFAFTAWDHERREIATKILIQADEENHPDY